MIIVDRIYAHEVSGVWEEGDVWEEGVLCAGERISKVGLVRYAAVTQKREIFLYTVKPLILRYQL